VQGPKFHQNPFSVEIRGVYDSLVGWRRRHPIPIPLDAFSVLISAPRISAPRFPVGSVLCGVRTAYRAQQMVNPSTQRYRERSMRQCRWVIPVTIPGDGRQRCTTWPARNDDVTADDGEYLTRVVDDRRRLGWAQKQTRRPTASSSISASHCPVMSPAHFLQRQVKLAVGQVDVISTVTSSSLIISLQTLNSIHFPGSSRGKWMPLSVL